VLLGGVSTVGKFAGGTIAKIPIISNGPVDEALIDAGNLINSVNNDRRKKANEQILSIKESCVDGFRDEVKRVDALYNKPQVFYFDNENVYCVPALSVPAHSSIEGYARIKRICLHSAI